VIAAAQLVVQAHHLVAVELHPGIDERPDMLENEVAAERIVVEHGLPSQIRRDGAEGRNWRGGPIDRLDRHEEPHAADRQRRC
jgi:hypothetical protein